LPAFCASAELVGLAGKPALLMIMQQELLAKKDYSRLARISEHLAQNDNFTPLYAAAAGFAQAAALTPVDMDRQRYHQRCTKLIKRLMQFGGEVNERLRQEPDFAGYSAVWATKR
jgi:hypothetical protein